MSFVESLEETCLNRNDIFSTPRGMGFDDDANLSNGTTSTFSQNDDLQTNTLYTDLESSLSSLNDSTGHLGDETTASEATTKGASFKDIFTLNVEETQKLPLIPAANIDYNFSGAVAPPHGVFYGNPSPTDFWSPHYEYTHAGLPSRSEQNEIYQSSTKPSNSQLTSATPDEVIDLTHSPSVDEARVDTSADGNISVVPLNQSERNAEDLENKFLNSVTNFSFFEPPFSAENSFLTTSSYENLTCSNLTSINNQAALPLPLVNNESEMTLSSEHQEPTSEFFTGTKNDTSLTANTSGSRKKNCHHSKKGNITVQLANKELWKKFHEIGTEMIITKAGRRMFPSIKLEIRGLQPLSYYIMAIDIVPVDNNRYRYVYHSSQWMAAGTTDSHPAPRTYIHPDSPSRGELWMRQPITFDKLKLTNHDANKKGHTLEPRITGLKSTKIEHVDTERVILHSMHKYQPRVHVIEISGGLPVNMTQLLPWNKRVDDVIDEGRTTIAFPECAFTTVTAYQNQQITKLKIDRNPFAKGFRETNKQWRPKLSEDPSSGKSDSNINVATSLLPNSISSYCPSTTGGNTHQWPTRYLDVEQTGSSHFETSHKDFMQQTSSSGTCLPGANFQCFAEKIVSIPLPTAPSAMPIFHDDVMGDVTFDPSAQNRSFQELLFSSSNQSVNKISNYEEETAVSTQQGQII